MNNNIKRVRDQRIPSNGVGSRVWELQKLPFITTKVSHSYFKHGMLAHKVYINIWDIVPFCNFVQLNYLSVVHSICVFRRF